MPKLKSLTGEYVGELCQWAVRLFKNHASVEDILEALTKVLQHKKYYNTENRVIKGVAGYLNEVKGTKIPVRIDYYSKTETVE